MQAPPFLDDLKRHQDRGFWVHFFANHSPFLRLPTDPGESSCQKNLANCLSFWTSKDEERMPGVGLRSFHLFLSEVVFSNEEKLRLVERYVDNAVDSDGCWHQSVEPRTVFEGRLLQTWNEWEQQFAPKVSEYPAGLVPF